MQQELWTHIRIHIHGGKTQVLNLGGERPEFCDVLKWIAQATDPEAREWKGPRIPPRDQGVRVLGTPLGHVNFVAAHLRERLQDVQLIPRSDRFAVGVGISLGQLPAACCQ